MNLRRIGPSHTTPDGPSTLFSWISLCVLAILHSPVIAQQWQSVGPWGGPSITLRSPTPDGERIYAVHHRGLFRSDNRGVSWTEITPPLRTGVTAPDGGHFALTTADRDLIVAILDDNHLYVSENAGINWRLIRSTQTIPDQQVSERFSAVAVNPADPDDMSLFVSWLDHQSRPLSTRWYRSRDGGQTFDVASEMEPSYACGPWGVLNSVPIVLAAEYRPDDPSRLLLSTVRNCNSGDSVAREILEVSPDEAPRRLLVPVVWDTLWWNVLALPSSRIVFHGNTVFWLTHNIVFRVPATYGEGALVRSGTFDIHAGASGGLYVATDGSGLLRSADNGQTWAEVSNSTFGVGGRRSHVSQSAIEFSDGGVLASNDDSVFFRPADSGEWQNRAGNLSLHRVAAIAVSPDDQRRWFGTNSLSSSSERQSAGEMLHRTNDGGLNWDYSNLGELTISVDQIVADAGTWINPSDTVLYATGSGCWLSNCAEWIAETSGFYRSDDGGSTWTSDDKGLARPNYHGPHTIALDTLTGTPAQRSLYMTSISTASALIMKSTNSGDSWAQAISGLQPSIPTGRLLGYSIEASPVTSGVVFFGALTQWFAGTYPALSAGLFRSTDSGNSWHPSSEGLPRYPGTDAFVGVRAIALHPTDARLAWLLTAEWQSPDNVYINRAFRSVDAGSTWELSNRGLPAGRFSALSVETNRPQYIYAYGLSGVFFSANSGETWHRIGNESPHALAAMDLSETHLYVGGEHGVKRLPLPHTTDAIFCGGFGTDKPCRVSRGSRPMAGSPSANELSRLAASRLN